MPARRPGGPALFDDFSYSSTAQLAQHGWIVRTKPGWPGVPGATWRRANVTVGHGLLRMTSSTDGTYAGTTQTQICQQRKFREGTYASHVRFRDAPLSRPAGDQPVESFYTISPLRRPLDPNYSEIDFEYLPNGGWGTREASATPLGDVQPRAALDRGQLGAPARQPERLAHARPAGGEREMTFYIDGSG